MATEYDEKIVNNLATLVLNETLRKVEPNKDKIYSIDPLTIIIIIGIIVNVIRVIQECNKDKTNSLPKAQTAELLSTDVRFRSLNHSWFSRRRIKKIIQKHLTKEQSKVYSDALLGSLLEIGRTVKDEQVSALLEY